MVSSLKEESSDESTIISSQTSTLKRNQGPDHMEEHGGDETLKRGTAPEGVLEDDEDDEDLDDDCLVSDKQCM